jgi:hypothetical protein
MLTAVASKLRIDKMRHMIALVMIFRDPFRLPEPVAEAGYRQAAIAPASKINHASEAERQSIDNHSYNAVFLDTALADFKPGPEPRATAAHNPGARISFAGGITGCGKSAFTRPMD